MTVAVAHQASSSTRELALHEAARQARFHETALEVIHVVETLDLDIADAYRSGLRQDVEAALSGAGSDRVPWNLHLATAQDDVADRILELATSVDAELLVIGARRRSPVGKLFLGSITQNLILSASMPVLVVK